MVANNWSGEGGRTFSAPSPGPTDSDMDHDLTHLELVESQLPGATTDGLTGLNSLSAFQVRLAEFYQEEREAVGLVVVDPDDFRAYNQAFGTAAGDEVLKGIGNAVKGSIRLQDFPARLSGAEFAVLIPNAEATETAVVAERIRRVVELHTWPLRPITVSVGFAWAWNGRPEPQKLVEYADRALLAAKTQGRNRVICWSSLPNAA